MIHIGGILLSLSFLCLSLQSYDLSPLKNFQFLKRIPDTLNSLSQIKSLVSIDSEYNRLSYPIKKDGNDVYFIDENNNRFSLLKGADSIFSSSSSSFHYQINSKEENEGTFLSFKFDTIESQHDARLGIFPTHAKLLTHSRIKRWWMAPSFHSSASTIPVETQLLLVELDSSASDAFSKLSSSILKTNYAFPSKKYAIIAPLIDFDTGFRVTLYGSEGGPAASNNNLAIRLESGDDDIKASMIRDALYISAGNDPYQLLATAYKKIAERLGTFRTRSQKLPPLGIDSFGFCTWDAFYSSVSGESVLQGVDSLSSIGFPPRFLIIDDGWQSTSSQKSSTISMATQSAEIVTQPIVESTVETAMSTNLTGTPMTGHLASEQIAASEQSPLLRLGVRLVSQYYSKLVESGAPDSWPVKLWATLSQTVLKDKLIDFFALQTDFSKRLTSWKANSKFENPSEGRSLRGLVETLKNRRGVNYVFVWHALSGYWGGVSEDEKDELPRDLNDSTEEFGGRVRRLLAERVGSSLQSASEKLVALTRDEPAWNSTVAATSSLLLAASTLFSTDTTPVEVVLKPKAVRRSFSKPTPHMLRVEPALAWDPSMLAGVGSVAIDRLEQLYYRMYSYLAESGVDGVKVDAQSGIGAFGTGNGGGSNIARACVTAMEKNVRLFFGNSAMKSTQGAIVTPTIIPSRDFRFLPTIQSIRNRLFYKKNRLESTSKLAPIPDVSPVSLVGCMCHSTENLLNFYETNLARVSDDFYPKDVASQTVHLVSCAYNSVMIGEIAIADYDMFSSNHVAAEMHAAVRAISGGPVYVSDAPGNHNATLLGRLVLPNGRILRTTLPARPTLDCLFKDVMRDGKTALKIWSFNKANAVLGVFNVQGAGWDQATRRYETYNMNPPVVAVESRPRDLPLEFASLDFQSFAYESKNLYESKSSLHYEPKSSTIDPLQSFREKNKKGSAPSNQISTNGGSRDNIFVAWSSAHRKLHFMSTKNDGVKHSLNSRDWDIITFCHLHSVPCNMNMESQHIVSDTASGLLVKDKVAKLFTRPLDKQHTAEEKFLSSIGTRHSVDSQTSHSKSNSGLIYWTPIGLLDMLNGGGAVDDIIPTTTSSTVSSSNGVFSVRGPGRCGIFSSRIPSKILVDNQQITTKSIHAEPQSFGGYLLTFELKAQGSNGRLLTGESTISILDSVGTASNLNDEYALGDKLRVVSVHWS